MLWPGAPQRKPGQRGEVGGPTHRPHLATAKGKRPRRSADRPAVVRSLLVTTELRELVEEQHPVVPEGCSMYPELAGGQDPSAQGDHREAQQRERQTDPAEFAPDARIIPRVRFGVDPEDSLKPHPNCLSSSAVSRG
jgi:hypothetical protein